jgi:tetratricopeptide (TPR) repeat protein
MPKLSLDVLKVQDAHRAGQAVTDRPVRLRREVKTKAFESPALTERLERDPSERDRGIDAVKMGPAIRQQLPTWFRTTKKGVGFLTSDQSLKQIVRGAIVPRGHSQENFEGNRVQSQRWTSKIPRTTSSQLFKGHDPVDEQTFGKSNERAQSLGGVDRATAGRRIPRDLSKKRKNVDVIVDIWPESQQYDRLGLPKILQQPQGQSTYLSGMRPGTNSRPRTSGRPAMQARMARRAERQRLEDMPEPIIHQHVQSIDDREKNNPRSVLQRLVEISSAEQDVIDSYVPEVLDAAANLCQQNQYAEAERLYRAVVAYSPQNIAARCNLGVIMERLHDNPVAAAEMYQSALDASGGKDVSCLLHLARSTYRTASDISKPRALLQKVLGIDPTHYGALNCMALLLLSEWIRSHSQLDRLATMDPSSLSEFLVLQSKQNQDPLRKTFSNTLFRTKSTDTDQVSGIQRSHSSSSQSSNANKGSTFVAEALKSATEAVKLSGAYLYCSL